MKKYVTIILCIIISMMLMAGCGMGRNNPMDSNNENENSTQSEQMQGNNVNDNSTSTEIENIPVDVETTKRSDAYQKYETMLNEEPDVENVYEYLDGNALNFKENEADESIGLFLDSYFETEKIDYDRILMNKNLKLSRGMISYLEAMQEDAKNPAMSDDGVIADQEELLKRSLEMENIYRNNEDGVVAKYAYDRYNTLLNAALTGNVYDAEGEHSYSNLTGTTVDDNTRKIYEDFITNYPDSHTTKVLQSYMDVLKESGNSISDTVTDFYEGMKDTVKGIFQYSEL